MPQITHRQLERYPMYLFSSDGSIYSLRYKKKMKPAKDKKGYLRTMLTDKYGNSKTVKVHRLIAEAFIFNPDRKPHVNHKNGKKDDNRPINLEWVTPQENSNHAAQTGLNGYQKLTPKDIHKIRELHKTGKYLHRELGAMFGVKRRTIGDILNGRRWSHI
jgi:hypothetical protein